MENQARKILGHNEITALAVVGTLAALHLVFWENFRQKPLYSVMSTGLILVLGAVYWLWRNYRLIKPATAEQPAKVRENLEGILFNLFQPRGFDIIVPASMDEAQTGWAELRDPHGIGTIVQYLERPLDKIVGVEDLARLDEKMKEAITPKGICLSTSLFSQDALTFARSKNILTRDSDQLIQMIKKAEEESRGPLDYSCRYCGTQLVESEDITGYWRCPKKDCGKMFSTEQLREKGQQKPGETNTFVISCYGCNRPVELNTTMSGLVECPYEDCSWIINVDNELLAHKGGLDKKSSERLAEITCPRCQKTIKVPADAEGLMECPCEEKWIIDVGAALGERAQAHFIEVEGGQHTAAPGVGGHGGEREAAGHETAEVLLDCPGCGAGVPANLENCPVCGAALNRPAAETALAVAAPAAGEPRQVTHRHAFMSIGTGGLLIFFSVSISAFLTFVYFITR